MTYNKKNKKSKTPTPLHRDSSLSKTKAFELYMVTASFQTLAQHYVTNGPRPGVPRGNRTSRIRDVKELLRELMRLIGGSYNARASLDKTLVTFLDRAFFYATNGKNRRGRGTGLTPDARADEVIKIVTDFERAKWLGPPDHLMCPESFMECGDLCVPEYMGCYEYR